MFKTLITLARGTSARASEMLEDQNALLILDQQIRDAAAALDRARRALAIAAAQDASEEKRIAGFQADIRDLETRATAALDTREDLAAEAAEAIAELEIDLAAAQASHTSFARESARLRALVRNGERRLADLERGRRTAQAAEAVRRLRTKGLWTVGSNASALRDAEATLARLRRNQSEAEIADDVYDELDSERGAGLTKEKLEKAGFGERTKPTAASVLERLKRARATQPPTP
ncbi:MAG TPA: PspA/IM30 family protein [Xanthobacteraceae bacterium]